MPNGSSGIRLQHISSDFPKHLKLIRWTRAFESLSLGGNLTPARAGFGKPTAGVPGFLPPPWSVTRLPTMLATLLPRRGEPPG